MEQWKNVKKKFTPIFAPGIQSDSLHRTSFRSNASIGGDGCVCEALRAQDPGRKIEKFN